MEKRNKESEPVNVGIGFYKREQWEKFKTSASDPQVFEDSYDEWLESFKNFVKNPEIGGVSFKMVVMDFNEFIDYCKKNDLKNTSESRAQFVSEKLRTEGGETL
jgi:hypothetical protein